MTTGDMSTVVSDVHRNTIVNLKQVNELPLRNALQSFDKNGDGKIDLHELQKIIYWYGLWKYASIGLCLVIMLLVWSTFGLTIWAINLTKDFTVTGGVMTGTEEVVQMSVANTYIPLSWASLLDRRHLDALESLTIEVSQGNGNFAAGVYHVKVASYVHANSTYIKLFGEDGSRVWVNSGTVVLHHPDADEAVMVCGAAACNTLAVDVKPEYLQQLVQRSSELLQSSRDFELPSAVDGVAISKAAGEDVTCKAWKIEIFNMQGRMNYVKGKGYHIEVGQIGEDPLDLGTFGLMHPDEIKNMDKFNLRNNGGKLNGDSAGTISKKTGFKEIKAKGVFDQDYINSGGARGHDGITYFNYGTSLNENLYSKLGNGPRASWEVESRGYQKGDYEKGMGEGFNRARPQRQQSIAHHHADAQQILESVKLNLNHRGGTVAHGLAKFFLDNLKSQLSGVNVDLLDFELFGIALADSATSKHQVVKPNYSAPQWNINLHNNANSKLDKFDQHVTYQEKGTGNNDAYEVLMAAEDVAMKAA